MKIIFAVRDDYYDTPGGDKVAIEYEKKYLVDYGHSVNIVPRNELTDQVRADVIHLVQLHHVESAMRTLEWSQRNRIPLVVTPLIEEELSIWFDSAVRNTRKWQILVKLLGRGAVQHIYTAWNRLKIQRSRNWRLQREIIQRGSLVTNSAYERNFLASWYMLPNLTATIVKVGIDPSLVNEDVSAIEDPLLINGLRNYVLEVGRIETRKNQLGLLEALYHVDLPIVFLGKPGPGSHGQEYYQDCKQLAGRRGNVYFIDFLPQQSLVKLFQHAAVHVLPSWSERPGQVTLEAIAYGCKSVSTIYSSISEYVGDNISYCDPNSPKSIREAIEQSLSTPFPTGLERYVLTNYTWEKNALGLLAHYQSLI